MAFTEDLPVFFDTDDFAVPATYEGSTVSVIFERRFLEQLGVQTSAPTALGQKSDFAAVAQDQTIVIAGGNYRIAEFQHDPPDLPDLTLLLLKV